MGLRKMVSRIPALRYIREVQKGTEAQKQQAERYLSKAIPLTTSLRDTYERNHVSDLVNQAFGRS